MRSARSRRERADHLIETRARDTLRSAWEKWSERYSESVLRPLVSRWHLFAFVRKLCSGACDYEYDYDR